jgi:DeoR family glycerol-3-phosphate regulon repressor
MRPAEPAAIKGKAYVREPRREDIGQRQAAIVELVREQGFASIEMMAERFGVSSQTIRRDIIDLSERRILQRHHGGAGLPAGWDRLDYSNRQVRYAAEKQRIGRAVAGHIPDGASLFIDIGTTTEAVARALVGHRELRIVTNHITVASILCEHTDFDIILTGGMVRNRDRAVTGEATADFLKRFRVGYAIFGIGSIDANGQLLDYDYRDVHVSQTAMSICRTKFVVADHSKFNGDAMMQTAHISEIDALFTDEEPPAAIKALARSHNVDVHVAGEDADGTAAAPGKLQSS